MGLLVLREAATVLRCTPQTVRKMIGSGELRAVKVGNRLRIDVEEIKRFIGPPAFPSRDVNGTGPSRVRGTGNAA